MGENFVRFHGKALTPYCFFPLTGVTFHLTTAKFLAGAGLVKLDPVITQRQIP